MPKTIYNEPHITRRHSDIALWEISSDDNASLRNFFDTNCTKEFLSHTTVIVSLTRNAGESDRNVPVTVEGIDKVISKCFKDILVMYVLERFSNFQMRWQYQGYESRIEFTDRGYNIYVGFYPKFNTVKRKYIDVNKLVEYEFMTCDAPDFELIQKLAEIICKNRRMRFVPVNTKTHFYGEPAGSHYLYHLTKVCISLKDIHGTNELLLGA